MQFDDPSDLIDALAKQSGVSSSEVQKVIECLGLEANISKELTQDELSTVSGGRPNFDFRSAFKGSYIRFFRPKKGFTFSGTVNC